MTDQEHSDHQGLPWPDAYRDLQPEEIYLHHKLSGKSGAIVYAADISSRDFSGQAILKLDRSPNSEWQEKTEAERHKQAVELAPAYAAAHLPKILHTLHHGDSLAVLSTIAGRGLEYAKPWAECAHDVQLKIVQGWLGYRLNPDEGRLHSFLREDCGIASDEKSLVSEGHWYPNPLAFATAAPDSTSWSRRHGTTTPSTT
jgi:hypothetical protein